MANYATLKAAIQDVVKTNGNNEITGALLQQSLLAMINSLGANYQFAGIAFENTSPGTPDQNIAYIAGPGTYANFGGTVVNPGYMGVFLYNGSWTYSVVNILGTFEQTITQLNAAAEQKTEAAITRQSYYTNRQIDTDGSVISVTNVCMCPFPVVAGVTYSIKIYTTGTATTASRKGRCGFSTSIPAVGDNVTYIDQNIDAGTYKTIQYTPATDGYILLTVYGSNHINDPTVKYYISHFPAIEAAIADLTSGLAALRGTIKNDSDVILTGHYYNLTHEQASETPNVSTSWFCTRLDVLPSAKFTITTRGGSNGRAYAITDINRNILERADASSTTQTYEITIPSNGVYLYINCQNVAASEFSVYSSTGITPIISLVAQMFNQLGGITGITSVAGNSETLAASQKMVTEFMDAANIAVYKNPSFPYGKKKLKALIMGNSYTNNSCAYLDGLIGAANIDKTDLCVYRISGSGYSIDDWIARITGGTTQTLTKVTGDLTMVSSGSMATLLAQDWDVIMITQASASAVNWSTFANLQEYIGLIRRYCTNQSVCIIYQMPWAHQNSDGDYTGLIDSTRKVAGISGIDYIVPAGMAVRNARNTSLENEYDLTSDGTHLCPGVGQYIAGCTLYQCLIAPCYGTQMVGIVYNVDVTAEQISESHAIAVTDANRELCQLCAFYSTIDMFHITEIE